MADFNLSDRERLSSAVSSVVDEYQPPGVALVLDEGGAVSEIRFDRMVRMVRNDRLEPWP